MAKKTISLKLTSAKSTNLAKALGDVEAHIQPALDVWPELLPEQRAKLLEHSPLLKRVIDLAIKVAKAL